MSNRLSHEKLEQKKIGLIKKLRMHKQTLSLERVCIFFGYTAYRYGQKRPVNSAVGTVLSWARSVSWLEVKERDSFANGRDRSEYTITLLEEELPSTLREEVAA